jgi:hypothetical protein
MPQKSNKNLILIVVSLIVVLGIAYVISTSPQKEATTSSKTDTANEHPVQQYTKENVTVAKVDLSKTTGTSKIPSGFPKDIPVETANITDSFTANYPDKGVVQSSVSFTTAKTVSVAVSEYLSYMKKAGYIMNNEVMKTSKNYLLGTLNKSDLSIFVNSNNGKTQVQMTYLSKK